MRATARPGLLLMLLLLLVACAAPEPQRSAAAPTASPTDASTSTATSVSSSATTSVSAPSTTQASSTVQPEVMEEYRPGREANIFLPATRERAPLMVMVPGGAWRTADPAGLGDLARRLADSGLAVLTVEVGTAEDGVTYPVPVEDVLCATAFGVDRMEQTGLAVGPVILLGHSSGAHLASLAASTTRDRLPACPSTPVVADAMVGLAGVYDVTRLPALAYLLFGVTPDEDPETWEEGNPLRRAGDRPGVPVLLLHGESDPLVPISFTQDYADALSEAGHDTTVELIPDADHQEIYSGEVSGQIIADWVGTLEGQNGRAP